MPDFRGGSRQQSAYGQELVKAIREGRTERQRDRDFNRKVVQGIIGAGATAVQAGMANVANDRAKRASADRALHDSSDKYMAADYTGRTGDAPDWLGKAGEGNSDMLQRGEGPLEQYEPDVISAADKASSNQDMNASRETAPVATWYTPAAREREDNDSNAMANDFKTAEFGMRGINPAGGGGMMGSLPGRRR